MTDSSSRSHQSKKHGPHGAPDVFGQMQPLAPPPELRQRALLAARRAATAPAREAAWSWPAIPRFDLAWASALLLLILGNLAFPLGDRAQPRPTSTPVAALEQRQLGRELGMDVGFLAAPVAPDSTRARERLRQLLETGGEGRS